MQAYILKIRISHYDIFGSILNSKQPNILLTYESNSTLVFLSSHFQTHHSLEYCPSNELSKPKDKMFYAYIFNKARNKWSRVLQVFWTITSTILNTHTGHLHILPSCFPTKLLCFSLSMLLACCAVTSSQLTHFLTGDNIISIQQSQEL